MRVDEQMMRRRATAARVARLATVRSNGAPHLVVCCFALEREQVYSAIDQKPKTTDDLQRLDNVRANPAASLLIDHYDDDWSQLWWVRVDCVATVVSSGRTHDRGLALLMEKYEQYRDHPPQGDVIAMRIERWSSWP